MPADHVRQLARERFAKEVEAQGPAWRNTADSIRAGFTNVWIGPAIAALEGLLRLLPDDTDPDDEGRRA